jgi:hypothetical protein
MRIWLQLRLLIYFLTYFFLLSYSLHPQAVERGYMAQLLHSADSGILVQGGGSQRNTGKYQCCGTGTVGTVTFCLVEPEP